jgi:hypothetical protein
VLREALLQEPCRGTSDLRPLLRALLALPRPCVTVVLSDFALEPPLSSPDVRRLLAACAARHETCAVVVPGLQSPPRDSALYAVDPETREPHISVPSPDQDGEREIRALRRQGTRAVAIARGENVTQALFHLMHATPPPPER